MFKYEITSEIFEYIKHFKILKTRNFMEICNTHGKIYNELSKLINITFAAQLKDSPIVFSNFFKTKNVITNEEHYALLFKDEKHILVFTDRENFITNFISFLDKKIVVLEKECEDLNSLESVNFVMRIDANEVSNQNERLGHSIYKLDQIRKRLIKCMNP